MKKFKIRTISLQELHDYKNNNKTLPPRSIVITFDDGYLDNWVFAYPLLKKYGYSGTIFINPEFVDPRNIVRKNLEDVSHSGESIENLEKDGFLSWQEIKQMDSEGVIDIQSHSMSHTWFYCSEDIIDFHSPLNNRYPWLFWNEKPEQKSNYLIDDQTQFVPYGIPVYKNGRSLGIKRYFEDQDLNKFLVDFVKSQGNTFFDKDDWKNVLFKKVELYKSRNNLKGRYESDEEQRNRFSYELKRSKEILEEKLDKPIRFLCWPGGARNEISEKMSFKHGYLAYTLSATKGNGSNTNSEEPSKIYRIGPPNYQMNGNIYYLGGLAFILRYFSFRMKLCGRIIHKLVKITVSLLIVMGIKNDGLFIKDKG